VWAPDFVSACSITVGEGEAEPVLQPQVGRHEAHQVGQVQLLATREHAAHVRPGEGGHSSQKTVHIFGQKINWYLKGLSHEID